MALQHSTEALRRAFQLHRRPTWPADFEAAMADEFVSRLVRLRATGDHLDAQRRARMARTAAPVRLAPPMALDVKRRAAGERDDD